MQSMMRPLISWLNVRKRLIVGVAVFCAIGPTCFADDLDDLKQQVSELRQRVNELEQKKKAGGTGPAESKKAFALPAGMKPRKLASTLSREDADLAAGTGNDRDFDGLTDTEEAALGTNPAIADTDGDALPDGWEVHGVNGIDLPGLGASPLHKDIFVEMDYMERASATRGLRPSAAVIERIRQSFAQAPVDNPDSSRGITMHLELGNFIPYDADLSPYQPMFFALKGDHFESSRSPVYRYMIWANGYDGDTSSGVAMGIPHSDFLVTLGRWGGGTGGSDDEKVGTFIHELGHTLGLRHGGVNDDLNNKPNHISVMNYSFQTGGVIVGGGRRFTYQPFALPTLRENSLAETLGLGGGSELTGYHTIIDPDREVNALGPIDWNGNGRIDVTPVRKDLNGDSFVGDLLATPNQWTSLIFNGGSIGSRDTISGAMKTSESVSIPFPYVELTEEMNRRFKR